MIPQAQPSPGPTPPPNRPRRLGAWLAAGLAWTTAGTSSTTAQSTPDIPSARPPAAVAAWDPGDFLRLLPPSGPWEQWLTNSGVQPPDFAALPRVPFLPDPLRMASGRTATWHEWPQRRQEILQLFQHYVTGAWPASPTNLQVAEFRETREGEAYVHQVTLAFGPRQAARLRLELILPNRPPPFPVFVTQDNHRRWALTAVSRGYAACVYAGADSRDDTADWAAVWPGADWSKLTRRAWAASRCVDYLHTLPFVNKEQIALAGHSRNGKTSLIAAAFDPRIKAVISSSSGAGGACSWRLFSEAQFGEGIENITRVFPDWFHPRLRFFAGRETQLPVDQPQLIACIAPRPCLISSALNDGVESIWAIEQTYYSARRAWAIHEQPGELNLLYRPGGHETRAQDIENYVDWLDSVFKRRAYPLPDAAIYPTYTQWQKLSGEEVQPLEFPVAGMSNLLQTATGTAVATAREWDSRRTALRDRVLWGLGAAPPFAPSEPGDYGAERPHLAALLGRQEVPAGLAKRSLNFGNYVAGDLWFPTNTETAGGRLPVLIWLHPTSPSHGYTAAYRRGEQPHLALARLGCAVFAFDQVGHGTRLQEVQRFYERYPHWSLLGKHVEDTLAAVEAMEKIPFIDRRRIWLFGYGTGGMTALHAAALDDRVHGVVSVGGFTPLRLDTAARGTGGLARHSTWLPLQPRLAAFIGHENRVPYDYHELLALIAPRPALVFHPRLDPHGSPADVRACVDAAQPVYELLNGRGALAFHDLDDYHHFSPETQRAVFQKLRPWLER
ncbi:MAG: 4-O-methyl-glucuronoyl methylesterase [Verrucomicrobiota bacterium]